MNIVEQVPTVTLLFVEDDPKDLEFWSKGLRDVSASYSILNAKTPTEALNVCRDQRIDCVVLDLALHESSGFELLFTLIPDSKRPKIPVVVLTHLVIPYLHELALRNGARASLMKSHSSPQELSDAIQKAIGSIPA